MSAGKFTKAGVLCMMFLSVQVALAQQGSYARTAEPARQLAARPVSEFSFHGTGVVDALLALGRQEHIPLAIESVDLPFVTRPASIDVTDTTVGSLLGVILAGSRGYRWAVRDGVIHVTNPLEPPARGNLLDLRIPLFKIGATPLTQADWAVWVSMAAVLEPGAGVAGSGGIKQSHPVGPLTLHGAPIWAILDALIKFPPGGAWVAMVPPPYLNHSHGGLWKLVGYDPENFQSMSDILRYSLRDYPVPTSAAKRRAAAPSR